VNIEKRIENNRNMSGGSPVQLATLSGSRQLQRRSTVHKTEQKNTKTAENMTGSRQWHW